LGFIYVLTTGTYGFGFLKYNSSGSLLVNAAYSPSGYDNSSVAFDVTRAGDVYITGISSINFNHYMYTVKFNSNGVFQWGKIYGAANSSSPSDIKVDNVGNVIIVGGATVKYNPNGDTLWTRHFASNEKIVLDDSNNIYTTGYIGIYGECLKYSPIGNLDWFTIFTIDSSNSNIGQGIALDMYGNIYVIGTSSVPFSGLNNYLIKLSNGGVILWNKVFTGIVSGQGRCELPMAGPVISANGSSVYYTTDCVNGTGGGAIQLPR
jgi:hypothetical protein